MHFLKELDLNNQEEKDPKSYPLGSDERTRPWLNRLDLLHERFMNLVNKYDLKQDETK